MAQTSWIYEMIMVCALIGIGLPIGIGFILAANTTGWDSTLATLFKVGMPSLLILMASFGVLETIKRKGA